MRAPKDGLPATETTAEIQPLTLIQVPKSIYGLVEAPRLWYQRAVELLEKVGFTELASCRATFILQKENGLVQAICCLHVDDGLLAAQMHDPDVASIIEKISSVFNIKEWKRIQEKPARYLGEELRQNEDFEVTKSMNHYLRRSSRSPSRRIGASRSRRRRRLF